MRSSESGLLSRAMLLSACLVVVALGVSGLASQRRCRTPIESSPSDLRSTQPDHDTRSEAVVSALRDGQLLDVNQASPDALRLLPGIGPKLAQRIVDHRRAHGPFRSLAALDAIDGVGPKTLARLAPLVRFSTAPQSGNSQPALSVTHK